MIVTFPCRSCGQKLRGSAAHAGRTGRCTPCYAAVTVPSALASRLTAPPAANSYGQRRDEDFASKLSSANGHDAEPETTEGDSAHDLDVYTTQSRSREDVRKD